MASAAEDVPSFDQPPVTEVGLSIQFASIPGFRSVHIGLLWQHFRQIYPKVSEQAPVGPVFETFGSGAPSTPQFQIETLMVPPMARFWFESTDGVRLLQVQQDRLIHNWRKINNEPYPRYEPIRERFFNDVGETSGFLEREGLGPIQPNQCEVVYTNVVTLPDGTDPHSHLERITPLWRGWEHEAELAPLENVSMRFRYLMRSDEVPVGRVYVEFQPVRMIADAAPAIKIDITARGKPRESNIESAFQLLDVARRAVVRTFDRVTTQEMHSVWGKVHVS